MLYTSPNNKSIYFEFRIYDSTFQYLFLSFTYCKRRYSFLENAIFPDYITKHKIIWDKNKIYKGLRKSLYLILLLWWIIVFWVNILQTLLHTCRTAIKVMQDRDFQNFKSGHQIIDTFISFFFLHIQENNINELCLLWTKLINLFFSHLCYLLKTCDVHTYCRWRPWQRVPAQSTWNLRKLKKES